MASLEYVDMLLLLPYSAMTQGECLSTFARAWQLTDQVTFVEGARRAPGLLTRSLVHSGLAIHAEGNALFLEEMPSVPRCSIINGWVFALLGMYDFWLAFDDDKAWALFQCSLTK